METPDEPQADTPLITCWRGTGADVEPVACTCKVFGWPNQTTAGDQMFRNTHFATSEEAWESIISNAESRLQSRAESVTEAMLRLQEAHQRMVEAGMHLAAVNEKRPR